MKLLSSLMGLLGLVFVVLCIRQTLDDLAPYFQTPITLTPPAQQLSPKLLRTRLKAADAASQESIDQHLDALDQFFSEARRGTEPFAEVALGLSSKLRLVADALPYSKHGQHERFLREQFQRHIFSEHELEQALHEIVQSYLRSLQSIDNQLLVELRADVADLSSVNGQPLPELSFELPISQTLTHTWQSLPGDVSREVLSLLTAAVLTRVAARLGVSAGILGTGAASSVATVGVGFLAAVVVDHFVTRIWNHFADPKGKLSRELEHSLELSCKELRTALSAELTSLAKQRAQLRQTTLNALLNPPS